MNKSKLFFKLIEKFKDNHVSLRNLSLSEPDKTLEMLRDRWISQRKLSSLIYKLGIFLYEQDALEGDLTEWLGLMPQYIEESSALIKTLQKVIDKEI